MAKPQHARMRTGGVDLTDAEEQVLDDLSYLVAAGPRTANGDGLLRLLGQVGRASTARDRDGLRSALVDLAAAAASWAGRDDPLPRREPTDLTGNGDRRWGA